MGSSGIFLTYSAAEDFNHKHVTNVASGTLVSDLCSGVVGIILSQCALTTLCEIRRIPS